MDDSLDRAAGESAMGQNAAMPLQRILVPLASVLLLAGAYHFYDWGGVAAATGVLLMWLLLHFTQMMQVLKRAAHQPIGYVGSAVMLNAKLKPGLTLLHVIAMTRALGELKSPPDAQPEIYRWTDGAHSHVNCEFRAGRLKKWELQRPVQTEAQSQ